MAPARTRTLRRQIDPGRLGLAAARPGIDPRTWVAIGVVEELGYSTAEGLIMVLRVVQGALVGEMVTCELAPSLARSGALISAPIAIGDVGVMVVPDGDANNVPAVVGFLRMEEAPAPSHVNGRPADLALLGAAYVLADPERELEVVTGDARIVSPTLKLGPTHEPTQPYVRGQALAAALGAFCDGLSTFSTGASEAFKAIGVAATGSLTPLKAPMLALEVASKSLGQAAASLKAELVTGHVLSKFITGE
jgi:hypothetical protein